LDQAQAAESTWVANANAKLDEKLPTLGRCASGGRVKREERIKLQATFSASGAWVPKAAAKTTLPDCRVFECVAKALATTNVGAFPHGGVPSVTLDLFLTPDSPPRRALPTDPLFDTDKATSCGPATPPAVVSGRLEPAVIQKVVRENYGEFRKCYEEGLSRNPKLQGRVSIRFVIERDGRVGEKIWIVDNTLPDCKVARCVRDNGYPKLVFPPPTGGIVTVVYPIMLEPG
jgi:hypothetical protein